MVFLILAKPFKEKVDNILIIINEIALFIISFLQLFFVTDIKDVNFINYVGWVMIAACGISKNFSSIIPSDVIANFAISIITNIRLRIKQWKGDSKANSDPFEVITKIEKSQPVENSTITSSMQSDKRIFEESKKSLRKVYGIKQSVHSRNKVNTLACWIVHI